MTHLKGCRDFRCDNIFTNRNNEVAKPKEQRIETEEFVSHLQSFQKLGSPTMGNSTQTVHQFLTGHPNASVTVHPLQKTKTIIKQSRISQSQHASYILPHKDKKCSILLFWSHAVAQKDYLCCDDQFQIEAIEKLIRDEDKN
jgi:hypothetical protein